MATRIETDRLVIRSMSETDLADFTAIVENVNVAQPAGFQATRTEFETHFLLQQTLHQRWIWGIELAETHQLIGTIGLYGRSDENGRLARGERDLGYMLNEAFWGRGYMSEAVVAVLNYGFDHGLQAILGSYFADNARSAGIFTKCGFQFTHQLQHDETDFFAPGKVERFYKLTPLDFWRATGPQDSANDQ
ncbi:GNAT family N-acetyltransferase [Furfurilactobacillus sp. WILCCON 0119]